MPTIPDLPSRAEPEGTIFKSFSFEYNAQRIDIFKAVIVCSYEGQQDEFKEGTPLNIPDADFYGVITESKNSGERLTIDIVAESWARELRNTGVTVYQEFRQHDAIKIIKTYLLLEDWEFEYPVEFDTNPRFISYILRNGSYISHLSTIFDLLGLEFTIYSTAIGDVITKHIKAYYRDNFEGRDVFHAVERQNISSLSLTVDYGKVATSIVVMGAESEQGTEQTVMDAEIGDWHNAPRAISIRDTTMKKPDMTLESKYFWYFPASETDYTDDQLEPDDIVVMGSTAMKIDSIWFLPQLWVASYETKDLTEDDFPSYLRPISEYDPTGVIVASLVCDDSGVPLNLSPFVLSPYGTEPELRGIYDDVLITSCEISSSSYLTHEKNLPTNDGFFWIGSERIFYSDCVGTSGGFSISGMVRGVPTCAIAACKHCGTRNHAEYTQGRVCILVGGSGGLVNYCDLLASGKSDAYPADEESDWTGVKGRCPLLITPDSTCPAIRCPHVKTDADFATICPKGLTRPEIEWTSKYQHHKGAIVFPNLYYYDTDEYGNTADTYDLYARDSAIHKYGYLPTRVSVKGVADIDGLDKVAEGRLRLSALPVVGKCTLNSYDQWVIPASAFPGDVIEVECALKGRYDHTEGVWWPTQWFDVASEDPESEDWVSVASPESTSPKWVKYKQKFIIQKVSKSQRGLAEISFGAGNIGFQNITDYIQDTMDVTSQRHRNQDPSKIVAESETGIAAKVVDLKTGSTQWVRMVR
jgi:hypothetical protein